MFTAVNVRVYCAGPTKSNGLALDWASRNTWRKERAQAVSRRALHMQEPGVTRRPVLSQKPHASTRTGA